MSKGKNDRKLPALVKRHGCFDNPKATLNLRHARIGDRPVTLQARVVEHLRRAIAECEENGIHAQPVSTYRSCALQRSICTRICGNPNGCSGTCAPPGGSWHQSGLAVDVYVANANKVVKGKRNGLRYRRIMQKHGFRNFSGPSGSDPNHWTLGVVG